MIPPRTPQRNDPEWTVGEEHRYIVRQNAEPWRTRGLLPTGVCRCERATPCFDHIIYLADLRTAAVAMVDTDPVKGSAMLTDATDFYLKLIS